MNLYPHVWLFQLQPPNALASSRTGISDARLPCPAPASDRVTLGLSPQIPTEAPARCLQCFGCGHPSHPFLVDQLVSFSLHPIAPHQLVGCLLATKPPLSQRNVTEQWTPSKPVDLSRQVQLSPQSIKIYAPFWNLYVLCIYYIYTCIDIGWKALKIIVLLENTAFQAVCDILQAEFCGFNPQSV